MIIIKKPSVYEQDGEAYLSADIIITEKAIDKWVQKVSTILRSLNTGIEAYPGLYKRQALPFRLWYSVEYKYSQYLCYERGDAFLVALLYFAMITGEDIVVEEVVSEKLLYQLQYYIIPMLCNNEAGYSEIHILAETTNKPYQTQGAVGTGISCGIDSLSTVFLHMQENTPANHKLTHLTIFNTGAYNYFPSYLTGAPLNEWNDEAYKEYEIKRQKGQSIGEKLGLDFVGVNSNLSDLYQGMFLLSHTYRNCSAVLALQGLWRYYYYSSAGDGRDFFKPSLHNGTGSYDILILQCLSTYSTYFYSGGMPYNRLEKTRFLIANSVAQQYLNVCEKSQNCGKCGKCMRTMTALDLFGCLNDFSEVFDNISEFEDKKWRAYCWILDNQKTDEFANQIYNYMEANCISFPIKSKLYHFVLPLRQFAVKFLNKIGILHG